MSAADAARQALEDHEGADWPADQVVMANSLVRAMGEEVLRSELFWRLERTIAYATKRDARLDVLAEDLRRALRLIEQDPAEHLRAWISDQEDRLRRRVGAAA